MKIIDPERKRELHELYPDLVEHGGLWEAIQAALTEIGSALQVPPYDTLCATVQQYPRESQVFIAAQERLFLFDFWSQGVLFANGRTQDRVAMARAVDQWLTVGCTSGELAAAFDFITPTPHAAAHERGEGTEYAWQEYLSTDVPYHERLKPFIAAAASCPELRQLFPYMSVGRFCFSRCTGYPYTHDTPLVVPAEDGQFKVIAPSGEVLGQGIPGDAARLVVAHLPPGCGPAVPGTADDLPGGKRWRSGTLSPSGAGGHHSQGAADSVL